MLVCPGCRRLVRSSRLTALVADAEAAVARSDLSTAMGLYRDALTLLPPDTAQYQRLAQRISALGEKVDAGAPTLSGRAKPTGSNGRTWGFASLGVLLLSLLSKGKLLLYGLANAQVLLTMLLAASVYWAVWKWYFAAGLVACIYVHEMGHVFMLRRYGMKASAPMFIPGLGALIRLTQSPVDVREDARIGLAGPEWGLAASLAFLLAGVITNHLNGPGDACLAIAKVNAWINLFNLTPFWTLDGGRAFRAIAKPARALLIALITALYFTTGLLEEGHREGLLLLIAIAAILRLFERNTPTTTLKTALLRYALLATSLTALTLLPVRT
jgi:Zn-dependent protease